MYLSASRALIGGVGRAGIGLGPSVRAILAAAAAAASAGFVARCGAECEPARCCVGEGPWTRRAAVLVSERWAMLRSSVAAAFPARPPSVRRASPFCLLPAARGCFAVDAVAAGWVGLSVAAADLAPLGAPLGVGLVAVGVVAVGLVATGVGLVALGVDLVVVVVDVVGRDDGRPSAWAMFEPRPVVPVDLDADGVVVLGDVLAPAEARWSVRGVVIGDVVPTAARTGGTVGVGAGVRVGSGVDGVGRGALGRGADGTVGGEPPLG